MAFINTRMTDTGTGSGAVPVGVGAGYLDYITSRKPYSHYTSSQLPSSVTSEVNNNIDSRGDSYVDQKSGIVGLDRVAEDENFATDAEYNKYLAQIAQAYNTAILEETNNARAWSASQNQADRDFNAQQAQLSRDFSANQNALDREFNAQQAQLSRQWQESFSASQNAFNSSEAQKARDWQEDMANTAYQRTMRDMQSAGLNPILAYQQGSSNVPTTMSATASTTSSGASASHSGSGSASASHSGSGSATSAASLIKQDSSVSFSLKMLDKAISEMQNSTDSAGNWMSLIGTLAKVVAMIL